MTRLTWICLVILATAAVTLPTWSVFRTGATPQSPSMQGLMQLALKTKPSTCAPWPCYQKNVGWCICCGDVIDCRAATGKSSQSLRRQDNQASPSAR